MAKIKLGKKGLFITFGLVLLGMTILFLALLLAQQDFKAKAEVRELAALDRVNEIYSEVQLASQNIFELAGIEIEINNWTISFNESLPNGNAENFKAAMGNYENFIEANELVELNFEQVIENLPLIIKPHNITYTHSPFGGDTLQVKPKSLNFDSYDLEIYIPDETKRISGSWESFSAGDLKFHIYVYGEQGKAYEDTAYLEPYANNTLVISGSVTDILIEIYNLNLKIKNQGSSAEVKTKIQLQEILNRKPEIYYPADTFKVELPEFNLRRQAGIKVR